MAKLWYLCPLIYIEHFYEKSAFAIIHVFTVYQKPRSAFTSAIFCTTLIDKLLFSSVALNVCLCLSGLNNLRISEEVAHFGKVWTYNLKKCSMQKETLHVG